MSNEMTTALKKRLAIAENALRKIDSVSFDFGYYEAAGRTMREIADKAIFEIDNLPDIVEDPAYPLIQIVEGIKGSMTHGEWVDKNGMRLKDTPEWVKFYVESKRSR